MFSFLFSLEEQQASGIKAYRTSFMMGNMPQIVKIAGPCREAGEMLGPRINDRAERKASTACEEMFPPQFCE